MMKNCFKPWRLLQVVMGLALATAATAMNSGQVSLTAVTAQPVSQISTPVTASPVEILSANLECASGLRPFNARTMKSKYRIGVHANRGVEKAFSEFNKTFADYLTSTAGRRFVPPIEFEMLPLTFQEMFEQVSEEEVDFQFANPNSFACMGVEYGIRPLATITSAWEARGIAYNLNVYGGVIATKADRKDINRIEDLKDKIIGASSITDLTGAQTQIYEMLRNGLSYVTDPKMVVFTESQSPVVYGVLNGTFDVGFFGADQVDRMGLDLEDFKVIDPKIFIMDDGSIFPFLHSTDIYAEWPFSALTHVDEFVIEEVQQALFNMGDHAVIGKELERCYTHNNASYCDRLPFPESFDPEGVARCEITKELALFARAASVAGRFSNFRPARDYFNVRSMLEATEIMEVNEEGDWKCARASSLYESINCPKGFYKRNRQDYEMGCERDGLECPKDYKCFCRPCIEANEVDVYEYKEGHIDNHLNSNGYLGGQTGSCDKMSVCGVTEQKDVITMRIYDNLERGGIDVRVKINLREAVYEPEVSRVNGTSNAYTFDFSGDQDGMAIVEVTVNGEQIESSPVRIQVRMRQCNIDFPGQGKVANAQGECVCERATIQVGNTCVSSYIFIVSISVLCFILASWIGFIWLNYKKRQSDQLWHIDVDELNFDDPMQIIGQGAFGVVVLAEYRGTQVAIKRVLPPSERRRNNKSGSRSSYGSRSMTRSRAKTRSKSKPANEPSSTLQTVDAELQAQVTDSQESQETDEHEVPVRGSDEHVVHVGAGVSVSFDVGKSRTAGTVDKNNDIFSLLGDRCSFSIHKRSKWNKWLPQKQKNIQRSFKQSLLGNTTETNMTTRSPLAAVLCPWFDHHNRQKQEFLSEMRLLSRLRHPCIATVMGAVVSAFTEPMLVMEYMEFGSLYDLLRNETFIATGDVILQMLRDLSQGLRYLHASKPAILHGDLKSKNILIDSRLRAKICDFGLSVKTENGLSGTPYFMAPEYIRGKTEYTTACDVYSFGITMWEIYANGESPYAGETPSEVLRQVCSPRCNKRPAISATVPAKMQEMMKRCWHHNYTIRPQAKDLDNFFTDMNVRDAEPSRGNRTKKHSGDMLYEVFPKHIADALKNGDKVEPENHDCVTVVFSDVVKFTDISKQLTPVKVCAMLDRLYQAFDKVARKHGVFKVETIGDAYMGVTNLNHRSEDTHAKDIAEYAVDIVEEAGKICIDEDDPSRGFVQIRVGFHSGAVVSNVIGTLNPRYGLFGDTVNTASRMESNSRPGKILCSDFSAKLLMEQGCSLRLKSRGPISVKGKGEMVTHWVSRRSSRQEATPEKPPNRLEAVPEQAPNGQETAPEEAPNGQEDVPDQA